MTSWALPAVAAALLLGPAATAGEDSDQDGLADASDSCPSVQYDPSFDWSECDPTDRDPDNDTAPECKARERVLNMLFSTFVTHIAFSVVIDGEVHFADAFEYLGGGAYARDPDGVHKLHRIGSTSKSVTAVAAKILDEMGELSFGDFVDDEDASRVVTDGERTLRDLLAHQGAFRLDSGALHLFCYPGDLAEFWAESDDLISPHYDSPTYGNLGGGYAYSAFNYSLAGAYLTTQTGDTFADILQSVVFDPAEMCTATLDGPRATISPIGAGFGTSQGAVMHVGPYINLVSTTDVLCEDNFYSSEDLPGDDYSYQLYHLDEASAEARDPAGGVMASVVDMAHFAAALLESYHAPGGLVSKAGIRELWGGVSDLGCAPDCPYEPFYGLGFFTDSVEGEEITQVGHGGSRAGYTSAFVIRPEHRSAVSILANADLSTVALSDVAKAILDDFEAVVHTDAIDPAPRDRVGLLDLSPNPPRSGHTLFRFDTLEMGHAKLEVFDARGRRVTTLLDRAVEPGRHRVAWRWAEDEIAPGSYFVRLSTNDRADVRKLVITDR